MMPAPRRVAWRRPHPPGASPSWQERAAERERERERRRAKLPSTSVVGRRPFKAYYAPEPRYRPAGPSPSAPAVGG